MDRAATFPYRRSRMASQPGDEEDPEPEERHALAEDYAGDQIGEQCPDEGDDRHGQQRCGRDRARVPLSSRKEDSGIELKAGGRRHDGGDREHDGEDPEVGRRIQSGDERQRSERDHLGEHRAARHREEATDACAAHASVSHIHRRPRGSSAEAVDKAAVSRRGRLLTDE